MEETIPVQAGDETLLAVMTSLHEQIKNAARNPEISERDIEAMAARVGEYAACAALLVRNLKKSLSFAPDKTHFSRIRNGRA